MVFYLQVWILGQPESVYRVYTCYNLYDICLLGK